MVEDLYHPSATLNVIMRNMHGNIEFLINKLQ